MSGIRPRWGLNSSLDRSHSTASLPNKSNNLFTQPMHRTRGRAERRGFPKSDERNDTKRNQSNLLPRLPPSRSPLLRATSRRLKPYRPPCRVTLRTAAPRPEGTQPLGPRWTRQLQGRVDSEWRNDNGFEARFRERRFF